jgi:hypothetical protein
MIVTYVTNNIVAGFGIFTASLVSIQFLINRYENRIETEIEVKISKADEENELLVSIINKGGKTIYLKSGGIIIKEGLIFDFDEKIKPKKTTQSTGENVGDKKPATRMSVTGWPGISLPIIPKFEMPEIVMPDLSTPFFPDTLNPGQSITIYRTVKDIFSFLVANEWEESDIYFKGFFKDQLNREYTSPDYLKYSIKDLWDLMKKN